MFIRDYGRHDLAQLRIKKDRLLDPALPGLYIRGDGTRVYFFKKTEIEELIKASPRGAGAGEGESESEKRPMFEIEQSDEDRRMVSCSHLPRRSPWSIWVGADVVARESEREVEDVQNMVTDQG